VCADRGAGKRGEGGDGCGPGNPPVGRPSRQRRRAGGGLGSGPWGNLRAGPCPCLLRRARDPPFLPSSPLDKNASAAGPTRPICARAAAAPHNLQTATSFFARSHHPHQGPKPWFDGRTRKSPRHQSSNGGVSGACVRYARSKLFERPGHPFFVADFSSARAIFPSLSSRGGPDSVRRPAKRQPQPDSPGGERKKKKEKDYPLAGRRCRCRRPTASPIAVLRGVPSKRSRSANDPAGRRQQTVNTAGNACPIGAINPKKSQNRFSSRLPGFRPVDIITAILPPFPSPRRTWPNRASTSTADAGTSGKWLVPLEPPYSQSGGDFNERCSLLIFLLASSTYLCLERPFLARRAPKNIARFRGTVIQFVS